MKYNFIAIEREYGSGGLKVAQKVAQDCGVPYYGREILEAVTKKYGVPISRIEDYEESATSSLLYSIHVMSRVQNCDPDKMTFEEMIFAAEQEIIRDFAAQGRAVFLGHCAGEALHNRSGVATVFIRSDKDKKRRRIIKDYNVAADAADATAKKFDKKRANYYYANTMKKWDDLRNYDMVLDSGSLGIDGCAAAIEGLLR